MRIYDAYVTKIWPRRDLIVRYSENGSCGILLVLLCFGTINYLKKSCFFLKLSIFANSTDIVGQRGCLDEEYYGILVLLNCHSFYNLLTFSQIFSKRWYMWNMWKKVLIAVCGLSTIWVVVLKIKQVLKIYMYYKECELLCQHIFSFCGCFATYFKLFYSSDCSSCKNLFEALKCM